MKLIIFKGMCPSMLTLIVLCMREDYFYTNWYILYLCFDAKRVSGLYLSVCEWSSGKEKRSRDLKWALERVRGSYFEMREVLCKCRWCLCLIYDRRCLRG